MSYESKDTSQQDSAPLYLFWFVRGSTQWRYVALPSDFTAGGFLWTGSVVTLASSIIRSGDLPKENLSVKLALNDVLAESFLGYAPDEITFLTVFRTHYDDPTNGKIAWSGRVFSSGSTGAAVTLACEPSFTMLRRNGLAPVYQRTCDRRFGKPGCNVNLGAISTLALVTATDGVSVTFSGLSQSYIGGNLQAPDGTLRMVIDQTESPYSVTLMRPVPSLLTEMANNPLGFLVTLIPGCNRSIENCRVHNNVGNFGGWVGMREINPMNNVSSVF
jgi:hypothetical protein